MAADYSTASTPGETTVVNTSPQPTGVSDYTPTSQISTLATNLFTPAQNNSRQDGCLRIVFSQMEFLPWDNPQNVVSAEVEAITRRAKDFLLVLLFLIGGPGNVINMAVFYRQGLKDRVNLCLFALALADELYLTGCILLNAEQLRVQFSTGERFGPVLTLLTNHHLAVLMGFRYVSSVLSAIIASERCYCVLRPLNYYTLMRTRTMAAIVIAVYVVVMALYFLIAFRYRIGCLYDPETGAVVRSGVTGAFYKAHQQFIDSLSALYIIGLVLAVMAVVTLTTIITAVKLREVAAWRSGTSVSISSREVVSLTKMLVGNSTLFIVCVFPSAVALLLWRLFPEMNAGRRQQNLYLTTLWIGQFFAFVNSCFNIVVYYSMGTRYRETFWALFGRKRNTERKA